MRGHLALLAAMPWQGPETHTTEEMAPSRPFSFPISLCIPALSLSPFFFSLCSLLHIVHLNGPLSSLCLLKQPLL